MSIQKFIKENINKLGSTSYVAPYIPDKKVNTAINSFGNDIDPDYIIAIYDSTIFSSGKDGCLFIGDAVYLKAAFEKSLKLQYADIEDIEYNTTNITNRGKTKTVEKVYIKLKNQDRMNLTPHLLNVNYKGFVELIQGILELADGSGEEFVNTSQLTPLAELDEQVKFDYLKLVSNFAFSDDQEVNPKEYAEIISLVARIEVSTTIRVAIRGYLSDINQTEETISIISRLKENVSEGTYEVIGKSLIKDMLYIYKQTHAIIEWQNNDFIKQIIEHFNMRKEEIELIIEAIQNDEDILHKRKNDSEIAKSIKDIASKAGAVGVPLAAIYFSGSVVGFSAAGITSGLATMGLGGLLGFSGMVTGIGAVVLIGVGTYHGLKKITGIGDVENNKQREFMLQAIIRNTQKTLNYLIEDINEITRQLSIEIQKGNENSSKIEQLSKMLNLLSKGAQVSAEKQNHSQIEQIITRLPLKLDMSRLIELTQKPTQEKIREFIMNCYEMREESEEAGNENKWFLRDNLTLSEVENLYDCFEAIDYNKLSQAALATVTGSVKKFGGSIFGERN
ncbi:hypothetical protein V7138_12910 [Bacillus sp. JJ1533]|uniref:hypothetical protein n=1 Tax=Bacillus sp. JJ1533 TaxID=3122959 RepID=UPI002FFF190D